jgi:hypothetical protein
MQNPPFAPYTAQHRNSYGKARIMPIDTTTLEGRNRELRNASLLVAKRHVRGLLGELGYLINATPTGERRNVLTEVNIHLMLASKQLEALSSEEF